MIAGVVLAGLPAFAQADIKAAVVKHLKTSRDFTLINRIPDFWDNLNRTIYEVKFISGEVRYTQQIRDMADWAFKNNFKFQLWIYEEAEISPAIEELERNGVLTVHRFGLF